MVNAKQRRSRGKYRGKEVRSRGHEKTWFTFFFFGSKKERVLLKILLLEGEMGFNNRRKLDGVRFGGVKFWLNCVREFDLKYKVWKNSALNIMGACAAASDSEIESSEQSCEECRAGFGCPFIKLSTSVFINTCTHIVCNPSTWL